MPVKTWDTKADFDAAYSIRLERYTGGHPSTRSELRGNYERRALFNAAIPQLNFITPTWDKLIEHFQWPLSTSICIIGVGFGWSIEYLNSLGYTDVWGTDSSVYIQGTKDEIDPADNMKRSLVAARIHDAKFPSPGEINRFLKDTGHRNGPGGETPFDVCITERMLTSLTDSEVVTLSAEIRNKNVVKVDSDVIHIDTMLQTGQDPGFNWKTAEEWKELLPDDIIVPTTSKGIIL